MYCLHFYVLQETTFPFDIQLSPQILPLEMQPLSFYFILLRRDGFAQQEKFVLPRNFSHYEQHSEVSQGTFQHFKCIVGFSEMSLFLSPLASLSVKKSDKKKYGT